MVDERLPGNREVLDALAVVSGEPGDRVAAAFRAAEVEAASTAAAAEHVVEALAAVVRHVRLAPIEFESKEPVIAPLKRLAQSPPPLGEADIAVWRRLLRELPVRIVEVVREPVELPAMTPPQEAAWSTILDLEEGLDCHWSLIGGQMVALISAEHGQAIPRATTDGDIVLGVWLDRGALRQASALLAVHGFTEDDTADGYGYRYRRGTASIDLLVPEEIGRQHRVPTTATGRRGVEMPGGNQALIRSERLPVRLGDRVGLVRRPNLLGALVAKPAASVADSRDPDRHREDIAILGQIALNAGAFRTMRRMSRDKDRKRLRRVLSEMPHSHPAWRQITEPREVREALVRLATPRPAA
ncbi:hypothetical protein B0I31_110219 [Saccharothrix carnea]|uniref:Uncharacterized protein n=1 Tax=Saccharothrix carnea TaxID=1280637 RepID=A0A2P8I3U2_SACCR|nr:hypothetical protein B0I31_110219 [Saccharothrix carnea]